MLMEPNYLKEKIFFNYLKYLNNYHFCFDAQIVCFFIRGFDIRESKLLKSLPNSFSENFL